jgi:hypothetical protein
VLWPSEGDISTKTVLNGLVSCPDGMGLMQHIESRSFYIAMYSLQDIRSDFSLFQILCVSHFDDRLLQIRSELTYFSNEAIGKEEKLLKLALAQEDEIGLFWKQSSTILYRA